MTDVSGLRTAADALQLIGVGGVIWDIFDIRQALHLRGVMQIVRDTAGQVGAISRRVLRRIERVFRRPKAQTVQLEAHGTLRVSGSAEMILTYGRAGTDSETIDKLLRIANEHQAAIETVQRAAEAEKTERASAIAALGTELHKAVEDVRALIVRLTGTRHGWRLFFALMIVVGLGLSLWADRLTT